MKPACCPTRSPAPLSCVQVQTFLLGGYETTANAISFAVYCVATNPDGEEL